MRKIRMLAVGATALALLLSACQPGDGSSPSPSSGAPSTPAELPTVIVGSADFDESAIVAEIYAQALEAAGFTVERHLFFGTRETTLPALESGELNLMPEYIGSLTAALGATADADSAVTFSNLNAALADRGLAAFNFSLGQDYDGFAVTAETAQEFDLETISDIAPIADQFTWGLPSECVGRDLCEIGLRDVYGIDIFNRGHEARNIMEARHLFAKAIEVDPHYARAYAGLADCDSYLLLTNDPTATYENVIANADRALELEPGLADAHTSRGIAMFTKGLRDEAEAEFERALELDPTSFEANFFYGRNCHAHGQFERAQGFYERTIALKPDEYRAWDMLRAIHVSLGHHEEAIEAARECLRLMEGEIAAHPDEPNLLCCGGCLLADLGETERGASWAAHAAALAGDDLRVLYNLACCYAKLSRPEEAIDCLERQASGSQTYVALVAGWMKNDSDLDALRDHPRYLALADRMQAQLASAKG